MLLALVGVMILDIGMYTSYNLSRAVYEKIQLQNAADATAYSLANLEARTFNFIAFANRAQVVNYVQMMEAQSLLSNWTHAHGMTCFNGDFILSVANTPPIRWIPALAWIGAAGETARGFCVALDAQMKILEQTVPNYIKLKTTENYFLSGESFMLAAATSTQLAAGGEAIVEANDPDARITALTYALNVINIASYVTAIDFAGMNLGSQSKRGEADRVMAEIANASRYSGTDGAPSPMIVARGPLQAVSDSLVELIERVAEIDSAQARNKVNDFLAKTKLHVGTTKLLSLDGNQLPDLDDTAKNQHEHSDLSRGEVLAAKDVVGTMRVNFASVMSSNDKSVHCRYEYDEGSYGRALRFLWLVPVMVSRNPSRAGFKCLSYEEDGHDHRWRGPSILPLVKGGIAPYFKFAPKVDGAISAEKTSFNQPDVWVYLNKPSSSMALGGSGDLNFEMRHGVQSAKLDARIGEGGLLETGFGDGLNVFARAQVYYHRPGAWQEPPNFFNPYWGARLAPKGVVLQRLASELGLPGGVADIIADNIWMH